MKTLWRELTKITKQIRGSENIFGYKTTVANQLYLLYCFSGKIYFTDKIHKLVKYLWYSIVFSQILYSFVIGWTYSWYGGVKDGDFTKMINVAFAIGGLLGAVFLIPLISFLYNDSIETMIDRVDNILAAQEASDSNQKKILVRAKKFFLLSFAIYVIFTTINLSICFFDVVLFFEESKVENYLYYAFPVFLNQKYNSMVSFFIINGISTIFFAVIWFQGWLVLGLISYWSMVWYNELRSLRDELNTRMRDLNAYFGEQGKCSNDYNNSFEYILKRSIRRFRKIKLLVDDLRGFFKVYGTLVLYWTYFFSLFSLYNSFLCDISAVLIVKNISACLSIIVVSFVLYRIGQNLENSISEVSMAIYSTPWYRSIKVRKNLYIFMCEIESVQNFTIFKMYKLLMNNLSRYVLWCLVRIFCSDGYFTLSQFLYVILTNK